jgi:type 2 lantibiotic biosynthesis protein LanM/predicted ribosomally synthesized peptide with nif11-like leader
MVGVAPFERRTGFEAKRRTAVGPGDGVENAAGMETSMNAKVEQLWAAAEANPQLGAKLRAAGSAHEIAGIASELGIAVSHEDIEEIMSEAANDGLSEEELAGVAGGVKTNPTGCPRQRTSHNKRLPKIDAEWVRRLARNAAPLAERDLPVAGSAEYPKEWLRRWEAAVAPDDPGKFAERLSWLSLGGQRPETNSLPSWTAILERLFDVNAGMTVPVELPEFATSQPFAHALLPLADNALVLLDRPHAPAAISEAARERLLIRLARLFDQTLEKEFNEFRPFGLSFAARFERESTATIHYRSFCQRLLNGGFIALCERYPALARLLGIVTELWVEETREFIERLEADRDAVESAFGTEGEPVRVESGVSDPHRGGREVRILRYSNGAKVVYKPRDMEIDVAWRSLLAWFGQFEELLPLWHPRSLPCEGYGWMEFVPSAECAGEEAARRYYRRIGTLLCLGYALRVNDLHHENVLVSGEHPVLIDLETLFVPVRRVSEGYAPSAKAFRHIERSVLSSLILPTWIYLPGGAAMDLSALAPEAADETLDLTPRWKFVNTDLMHRAAQKRAVNLPSNAPSVNGEPVQAERYVGEIVAGFDSMYRIIRTHRDRLLAVDGPLSAFRGCPVRIIFRPTEFYARLQRYTLAPRFLRNGMERSLELEVLYRSWLLDCPWEGGWRVAESEVRDMENLDIPYFSVQNDSTHLFRDDAFERSGFEGVVEQIESLSDEDLARQSWYISASFEAKIAGDVTRPQAHGLKSRLGTAAAPGATALVDEAVRIARRIPEEAFWTNGEANWVGVTPLGDTQRYQMNMLGPGLWSGAAGIGTFLAACYAATGEEPFRVAAVAALAGVRARLAVRACDATPAHVLNRGLGLGAADGLASLMFALCRSAEFLGESALLKDALGFADHITPESIAADTKLDLFLGAAGGAMGLLSLRASLAAHQHAVANLLLHKAKLCGDRLVETQRADGGWPRVTGDNMFGLAHGPGGIACALVRLYGATGERKYLDAAMAGIRFEHSSRDGAADFGSCCKGSPGIGLGRLACLPYCDGDELRGDIEAARSHVESRQDPGLDHLCCGAFGHVEYLVATGDREGAASRAAWLAGEAKRLGGYRLYGRLPRGAINPSLGQGLAGIGYQMLRTAYPERFPSLLIWE